MNANNVGFVIKISKKANMCYRGLEFDVNNCGIFAVLGYQFHGNQPIAYFVIDDFKEM